MRRTSDTTPLDPESLTECPCGTGRPHLTCDHVAACVAEWKRELGDLEVRMVEHPYGAAFTAMSERASGLRHAIRIYGGSL